MNGEQRSVISEPHELLLRMSATLRNEIGPAVEGPAKSQAYMASVVLAKLAKELDLAPARRDAERSDRASLVGDLRKLSAGDVLPSSVSAAIDVLAASEGPAALSALVRTLYAERSALGAPRFDALLGRVRVALRADVNRRMEFAG